MPLPDLPMLGAYLAWLIIAMAIFATTSVRKAVWAVLFSGWVLLPPAAYDTLGREGIFPYWIIGGALPSDVWFSKFWTVPLVTLMLAWLQDRDLFRRFIPHWTDFGVAGLCLWPLVQSLLVAENEPSGWLSMLYLTGSWGLSWILGRLFLADHQDMVFFANALAKSTLWLLPVAALEGLSPWRLHSALYGVHPFAFDGLERYAGYRPQAFFEHGNQYGIWCAGAAVAAFWLASLRPAERPEEAPADRRQTVLVAVVLAAMTLASQSVGAIALMGIAIGILAVPRSFAVLSRVLPVAIVAVTLLLAAHVSGVVPLREMAEKSPAGRYAVHMLKASGRGSFAWRISQDIKVAPLLRKEPLRGYGTWNWFAPVKTRPWGLPLLLLGQFGAVGLCSWAILVGGKVQWQVRQAARGSAESALAVVLVGLLVFDSALNSFLFLPAMAVAGAVLRDVPCRRETGHRV